MTEPLQGATGDDAFVLACTLYGEARGSTSQGRIAVAWVVRNRAMAARRFRAVRKTIHPLFGDGSIAGACAAVDGKGRHQFTCWDADDPNSKVLTALALPKALGIPAFRACMAAAVAVIDGTEPDPTAGSKHYHGAGMAKRPWWTIEKDPKRPDDPGRPRTPVANIGGHLFHIDVP